MEIELFSSQFFVALFSIIVLDLVLAGDNAVVIAMASNRLPAQLRTRAIYVGTAGAVLVRLIMTFFAVEMLTVPYLQALGGLVLLPIAVKLMRPSKEAHVKAADTFAGAVKTIIVADAAMGLDNVLAIAGASQGHFLLVVIGLIISIPIVVGGSQLIARLMDRYPVLDGGHDDRARSLGGTDDFEYPAERRDAASRRVRRSRMRHWRTESECIIWSAL